MAKEHGRGESMVTAVLDRPITTRSGGEVGGNGSRRMTASREPNLGAQGGVGLTGGGAP
jgi:hypothetical protein